MRCVARPLGVPCTSRGTPESEPNSAMIACDLLTRASTRVFTGPPRVPISGVML